MKSNERKELSIGTLCALCFHSRKLMIPNRKKRRTRQGRPRVLESQYFHWYTVEINVIVLLANDGPLSVLASYQHHPVCVAPYEKTVTIPNPTLTIPFLMTRVQMTDVPEGFPAFQSHRSTRRSGKSLEYHFNWLRVKHGVYLRSPRFLGDEQHHGGEQLEGDKASLIKLRDL